jgi:hypothetical protein
LSGPSVFRSWRSCEPRATYQAMGDLGEASMKRAELDRICREVRVGDRHLAYRDLAGLSVFDAEDLVAAYVQRLKRLHPEERLRLYRRPGGMSRWERWIWAARWPGEVPLVNGELEWIALSSIDCE